MKVNLHMDALAIQTWGWIVDAVIYLFPLAVKLKALTALTLPHATVMTPATLLMIAVMISLKLDVLVSHTASIVALYTSHVL